VIGLSLHDDVFSEILITIHTSGEKSILLWLLVIVVRFTFHDNILSKILITIITGGEELVVWDAAKTGAINSRLGASRKLEESSSSSNSLVIREDLLGGWAVR
jgi:hypothetical protein